MILSDAYIGLHLEKESERIVRPFLESQAEQGGMYPTKVPHLTLDYFGRMNSDTLKGLTFGTRVMLLLANRAHNSSPITLWTPRHLLSDTTGEDIIYLPAEIQNWFFRNLQYQWYSVRTPHVTLLKWENLSIEQIQRTLEVFETIIPRGSLFINTKKVFCHGKTERWDEVIRWYDCE